ncbi:MAG TPA: nicotinate-nucleotide--dimethylbenzimidazole phosphoribosyltransferase [Segeticoccus sp.]|nr:nicotinate-nucleotide--dimethylbenzimidazole phosphoribosyltransferase [Segeticoccus sp.]
MPSLLDRTLARIGPADEAARRAADERQSRLTKPPGSLGRLEDLAARLCGMYAVCPPPLPEPVAVVVFAGDHGVHARGVTPWPQEVTAQMVGNFLAGGAVVNALGRQLGADVLVVDVGVAADLGVVTATAPGLLSRKVAHGTADMTRGPAMTPGQARQAVEVGIEVADRMVDAAHRLLVTGDMGIANTTASAALVSAFTGMDPRDVTGRGTGVDDAVLRTKVAVVREALQVNGIGPLDHSDAAGADPLGTLAAVGGLEHAGLVGLLLGAAARHTPVVLDGVIAGSAALVAHALCPDARDYWVAGHRSAEPGASAALRHLGLEPLVDLGLRLGEGSGAALAVPLVQSAARVLREVATFDSAGVTEKG